MLLVHRCSYFFPNPDLIVPFKAPSLVPSLGPSLITPPEEKNKGLFSYLLYSCTGSTFPFYQSQERSSYM